MTQSELERRLGYKFTTSSLLDQALTHRSFGAGHNERLEFLGDSILNCCVAGMLFSQFPAMPEGELSRLRANLVNQSVLAEIAANLGLSNLLRLGDGEIKTGGANRPSILGDAVEAIIAAVFLDADFNAASAVVQVLFVPRLQAIHDTKPMKDAKTTLQEWLQSRHLPLPEYAVKRIEGESHRQIFHVECVVTSFTLKAQGSGASRRIAEQDAAAKTLINLVEQLPTTTASVGLKRGR